MKRPQWLQTVDESGRPLRLLEEATEAAQAAGVGHAQAGSLLDHVYGRPVGDVAHEIGACGIALLALAESVGIDADVAEVIEGRRVMSMDHTGSVERKRVAGILS